MPTTSDINSCLSIQDSIAQINCIRTSFGYAPVVATSSTTPTPLPIATPTPTPPATIQPTPTPFPPTCDGVYVSGNCISNTVLLIGGVGIIVLLLLMKK